MIPIDKIKEWVIQDKIFNLKYIRLPEGYRFCGLYEEHSSLLTEDEKPSVLSAGAIGFSGGGIFRVGMESMTLKRSPLQDDDANLRKLLGLTTPTSPATIQP